MYFSRRVSGTTFNKKAPIQTNIESNNFKIFGSNKTKEHKQGGLKLRRSPMAKGGET
jgi:hypothetical protein